MVREPPPTPSPSVRGPAELRRARTVARVLDDLVPVPGTSWRVGLDPLLGLVPVGVYFFTASLRHAVPVDLLTPPIERGLVMAPLACRNALPDEVEGRCRPGAGGPQAASCKRCVSGAGCRHRGGYR